jgi:hypothetical protein
MYNPHRLCNTTIEFKNLHIPLYVAQKHFELTLRRDSINNPVNLH